MALKAVISSLDEVDEAMQSYYRQDNGKYILDFGDDIEDHPRTGAIRKARDAERKAAEEAKKKLTDLQAQVDKYKDIDPEKAREALTKMQEIEEKQMLAAGDVDKLVEQKTERMRADYESRIKAKEEALAERETALKARETELSDIKIFTAVKDAAVKAGARPTALDDIVNRARPIFRLVDGQVTPIKPGSEDVWYGKSGDPMAIDEWVTSLATEADHLFAPNSGGNGQGSGGRSGNQQGRIKVVSRAEAGNYISEIAKGEVAVSD